MAINITYQQWLEMYQSEREQVMCRWLDNHDEYLYLVEEVGKRLKRSDSRIYEVRPGQSHGGTYLLHAVVDVHELAECPNFFENPQIFQGFPVYYVSRQPFYLDPEKVTWVDPEWSNRHSNGIDNL